MIERTHRNRKTLEIRKARYSDCEKFRYSLEIKFGTGLFPRVNPAMIAWIGLNPSTATERANDNTVTRCVNWTREWGYSGMTMLNLYAYRATDPKDMIAAGYPVGEETDRIIRRVCLKAAKVILCYGNHGQGERVMDLFRILDGIQCHAMRITKAGRPEHPLYLKGSTVPVPYDFEVPSGRQEAVRGGAPTQDFVVRQGCTKRNRELGLPFSGGEDG